MFSSCPVTELSEVIKPIQDINEEIYYTQFQAFRFGSTPTVYAHCTVEVCLNAEECTKVRKYLQSFYHLRLLMMIAVLGFS